MSAGSCTVVTAAGKGSSDFVVSSLAFTTMRCLDEYRGLHDVSVSVASGEGSKTEKSVGFTILISVTRYRNVPCTVVTMISSPAASSSTRKNGAP